ncbi:MAG TPA: SMP-30/gluconolactonase/LRE family protein [Sphingomicrobium sp.]|jgi:hypothetical protein
MRFLATLAAAALAATAGPAQAQSAPAPRPAEPLPFEAGRPLGVVIEEKQVPLSPNVKVYGAAVSAESCSYDATRKLIMAINRGAAQNEAPNDGFVSLLNPDGSVHTAKWIGLNRNSLVLNQPFGSQVHAGKLYVADSDGGTADGAPRVSVIRMFDIATGAPAGEIRVPESQWFNDIAVAGDGTIYATQTGSADGQTPMRVYKIEPDKAAVILVDGTPLSLPNGIAIDNDNNIVVVNLGNTDILTFSPSGKLLTTEQAAQSGNDGLVIMPDGTKYVSSVRMGGIQRIRSGEPATMIATGIPNAASMCLDTDANQLVIPMNASNGLAYVKL